MKTISITDLRKNLKETLDTVIDDNQEIIVHRPNNEDVVLISLSDYNSLNETLKLLSSEKNRSRLLLGKEQLKQGKTTKINLDEL
ncbi:prevent-host-death protein [Flavobacterium album]|uniref:Antitoxin n=1 Tax=Flavobacterium album TaxID=2175091 RepID=A0A2S1QWT7_9FLAO|nr:type II toxin-antitoxin system prevent-host-death family antitoxin [Flavobacterium album]AWH84868.1 prevent-host-death protein [Flavobacterium album]